MTIDSQFAAAILMGIIGVIAALGLIGTVGAFWTMGRSAYRKD